MTKMHFIFISYCNYIGLYQKTAFGLNFGLWKVPQAKKNHENMHFHFHAFSGAFSGAFSARN